MDLTIISVKIIKIILKIVEDANKIARIPKAQKIPATINFFNNRLSFKLENA